MDPNETLKRIDEFLQAHRTGDEVDDMVCDLARWLERGGFNPDWNKYPLATSYFACREGSRMIVGRRAIPKAR